MLIEMSEDRETDPGCYVPNYAHMRHDFTTY